MQIYADFLRQPSSLDYKLEIMAPSTSLFLPLRKQSMSPHYFLSTKRLEELSMYALAKTISDIY